VRVLTNSLKGFPLVCESGAIHSGAAILGNVLAVAEYFMPSGREMVSIPKIKERLKRKGDLPCGEVTGSCR
jgi:hypothetical protein